MNYMKFLMTSTLLFIFALSAQARIIKPMEDLFEIEERETRGKSKQQITKESLRDYDAFVAMDVNSPNLSPWAYKDAHKPRLLSMENAQIALQRAMSNPVVSLDKYSKYDPEDTGIGFCFGRAMFVNLYLATANYNRANMKKAFAMGMMSNGGWGWHVTTIVQSVDSRGQEIWLAIDPVIGYVVEVKAWYKYWQGASDDGKLRLYITEAGKFAPEPSTYDESEISSSFYRNYFIDMRKWFIKNDVSKDLKY
jgi:hypothetical protein